MKLNYKRKILNKQPSKKINESRKNVQCLQKMKLK